MTATLAEELQAYIEAHKDDWRPTPGHEREHAQALYWATLAVEEATAGGSRQALSAARAAKRIEVRARGSARTWAAFARIAEQHQSQHAR